MASYEDLLRDIDILSACLLGEYDKDGKYKIPKDVIELLVQSKKQIVSYKNDVISAQTQIGPYSIKFSIEMQVSKQEELKYASLYLIENYKFLETPYSVKTFLVGYSDFDDIFFLDKLKQTFNLYTVDDFDGKDISESAAKLQALKDKKKQLAKSILENLSDFNRVYIIDAIRTLKGIGEYGLIIQKLFKEQMDKLTLSKNDPKYWQELKKFLDKIILENKEKYPEQTKQILDYLEKAYTPVYNKAKENASKPKAEAGKAPAKKKSKSKDKEKKKDDSSKSSGGKSVLSWDWSLKGKGTEFDFSIFLPKAKVKTKQPIPQQKIPSKPKEKPQQGNCKIGISVYDEFEMEGFISEEYSVSNSGFDINNIRNAELINDSNNSVPETAKYTNTSNVFRDIEQEMV